MKLFAIFSPIFWLLAQVLYFVSNALTYSRQIIDGITCLVVNCAALITHRFEDNQQYTDWSISFKAIGKNTLLLLPMALSIIAFNVPTLGLSNLALSLMATKTLLSATCFFAGITAIATVGQLCTAAIRTTINKLKQCISPPQSAALVTAATTPAPIGSAGMPRQQHSNSLLLISSSQPADLAGPASPNLPPQQQFNHVLSALARESAASKREQEQEQQQASLLAQIPPQRRRPSL